MGAIRDLRTGAELWLPGRLSLGRADECGLTIADPRVSSMHASIRWRGTFWELRDLGSRNGTFVGDQRVARDPRRLAQGDPIGLGDPTPRFEVVDLSPPALAAERLDAPGRVVAEGGLLGLPDLESPEVVIYADARGAWLQERDGDASPVTREIRTTGARWQLLLPTTEAGTWEPDNRRPTLATTQLHFRVSRDEEHVELDLHHTGGTKPLDARAHHYLLLTLARERQQDATLDPAAVDEHGWVQADRLARMLAIDTEHLRVQVHRARRQFARAGIDGAAGIVERRAGSRSLRLGVTRISIQQT